MEFDRAMALAHHFEESSRPHASSAGKGGRGGRAFTLGMRCIGAISICARCTRLRTSLMRDLRTQAIVIVERTGDVARVEVFFALIRSHRITDYARTGALFSDPSLLRSLNRS